MDALTEKMSILLSNYASMVLAAFGILAVGWVFARLLSRALKRILSRARVDPTLIGFTTSLVYVVLLAGVVITALHRLGVPTVSFLGVVGAAGLAVGLALKGTLSNIAAGVMLIALRPFQVGDRIEAAGAKGVVQEIRVFATTLRADDDRLIIIPNASIAGGIIAKHSAR